jgi:tetratricopeptide (TPR) repeat protein
MKDSLQGRFGVICRENSRSPLYLRMAEKEINEGNYSGAVAKLEAALENNSDNAALYFLLGKAYAADGNFRSALQKFRRGSDLIKSEKTYQYYLREIENLKRERDEPEVSTRRLPSDFPSLLKDQDSRRTEIKRETDCDENLISETLAKIYLNQGESSEAIRIYEKLAKKFPVKKTYFEEKISEIKSGIK